MIKEAIYGEGDPIGRYQALKAYVAANLVMLQGSMEVEIPQVYKPGKGMVIVDDVSYYTLYETLVQQRLHPGIWKRVWQTPLPEVYWISNAEGKKEVLYIPNVETARRMADLCHSTACQVYMPCEYDRRRRRWKPFESGSKSWM